MRCLLSVLLLTSASVASAAGPRIAIITSEFPPALVQRAANELKADLKRIYDADVEFGASVVPGPPAQVILLGMPDAHGHLKQLSDPLPKLSEQGHALLSREYKGRTVLTVVGGSPTATYWAAAELAHQWGVRTMLYGDVDPVAPPKFSLDGFDIVLEPKVKHRAWLMDFDAAFGPASWPLADQRELLRQLARLKFNKLTFAASKSPVDAVAAIQRIPVSGDTSGRLAFGGAKFFENPDLLTAENDDTRHKASEELIGGIENEAKTLGMTVEVDRTRKSDPTSSGLLPYMFVTGAHEQLRAVLSTNDHAFGLDFPEVGHADLTAFLCSRGCFDAKFDGGHPVHDLVTPICGEGVSDRVLKAFELAEAAKNLITTGDRTLPSPTPDMVMKHYASSDPVPEWWGKSRDNFLNAMNEMYRANTRAREGGRSYTLYFARRFEFAFEYMNCLEAVRKAGIAKSKGDKETQIAELEKAVESMNGALNAMAAVARSQSDRGIIAVLNEYGYRPLVKELEAVEAK